MRVAVVYMLTDITAKFRINLYRRKRLVFTLNKHFLVNVKKPNYTFGVIKTCIDFIDKKVIRVQYRGWISYSITLAFQNRQPSQ